MVIDTTFWSYDQYLLFLSNHSGTILPERLVVDGSLTPPVHQIPADKAMVPASPPWILHQDMWDFLPTPCLAFISVNEEISLPKGLLSIPGSLFFLNCTEKIRMDGDLTVNGDLVVVGCPKFWISKGTIIKGELVEEPAHFLSAESPVFTALRALVLAKGLMHRKVPSPLSYDEAHLLAYGSR